jgi:hypothetical protein
MDARLRETGAQSFGFAHGGDAGAVDGDGAVGDDAGGGEPFGEGVSGIGQDLAQDQVGHLAPFEPM